jgi:hypothetical protein
MGAAAATNKMIAKSSTCVCSIGLQHAASSFATSTMQHTVHAALPSSSLLLKLKAASLHCPTELFSG